MAQCACVLLKFNGDYSKGPLVHSRHACMHTGCLWPHHIHAMCDVIARCYTDAQKTAGLCLICVCVFDSVTHLVRDTWASKAYTGLYSELWCLVSADVRRSARVELIVGHGLLLVPYSFRLEQLSSVDHGHICVSVFVELLYDVCLGNSVLETALIWLNPWNSPKSKGETAGSSILMLLSAKCFAFILVNLKLEMWANAQPDGRPAEYRWRPLFNAAKFGWRPLLDAV